MFGVSICSCCFTKCRHPASPENDLLGARIWASLVDDCWQIGITLPYILGIVTIQEGGIPRDQPAWWNARGVLFPLLTSVQFPAIFANELAAIGCVACWETGRIFSIAISTESKLGLLTHTWNISEHLISVLWQTSFGSVSLVLLLIPMYPMCRTKAQEILGTSEKKTWENLGFRLRTEGIDFQLMLDPYLTRT